MPGGSWLAALLLVVHHGTDTAFFKVINCVPSLEGKLAVARLVCAKEQLQKPGVLQQAVHMLDTVLIC